MTYQEIRNERELLDGCINRMFITDNVEELDVLYNSAQQRLAKLFDANGERIKEKEQN